MEINEEIVDGRPYPNEHAARLTDPDQYDSIRRVNDEGGPGVDFIYGIKDGKSEIQAIRFDKNRFTPAEAKQWLADHDFNPIAFEEATGEREEERAAPDGVKVGDFVEWDSSGGTARGKVEHVMREGVLGVPDSSFSINASEEDPAACTAKTAKVVTKRPRLWLVISSLNFARLLRCVSLKAKLSSVRLPLNFALKAKIARWSSHLPVKRLLSVTTAWKC